MFFRGVIVAIAYKCKCCAANLDVEEGMRLVKCPACRTNKLYRPRAMKISKICSTAQPRSA